MIQIIWEFTIRPASRAEFERHYGSEGTWAQLFRRHPEYRGSTLSRDTENPNRYLTVDTWKSLEAFRVFASQYTEEYHRLDKECEQLTEREMCHGYYEQL